jgi:hypothetical protein
MIVMKINLFFFKSLTRNVSERGSLDQLLDHDFIKTHLNDTINLELIQNLIKKLQEENDYDD